MPLFEELDPEEALRAIEGYQDELTAERERHRNLYSTFSCPRCHCELQEQYCLRTAFTAGTLVPKATLRCAACGYEVDPHTGLVIACGNAAKMATP